MEIEDAHKFLISLGWTFTGQTCGCGGGAKKRTYNKDLDKIIINLRTKLYEINNQPKRPISELSTNLQG
jgi:hypothetical protein